ncbi:non-ribosomal peptide synthetase [Paenibacillus lentus]|uniref:Amino acid adenylation domain-containing protein n=1 Tax=Paenibacillus lentus TaxID=1338368 RepID=A0A3S8S0D1_9BACL|nr:amino acid adenylation domain-containing protein [Paenibacillus lentus]AZK48672.1 amino acid adenylation domain-containing protein [Paenibacillus lentus]
MNLTDLNFMSSAEREKILQIFNDTDADYPKDLTIHKAFEQQVQQRRNEIAVVSEGEEITYGQLNERANQLAASLRKHNIQPGHIVGILADKSMDMIAGILAVLKAGGAYMPIDPSYPQERIEYMLQDSGATSLLLDEHSPAPDCFKGNVIAMNDPDLIHESISNPEHVNHSSDLAYIIYTSGSTGKPKGVMIEHRNVIRLFFNDRNLFDFSSTDVWTLFHSCCFDFSVWEMYGALLHGGKLIVIKLDTARDPHAFLKILRQHQVTILNQTPTAFYQLLVAEASSRERDLFLRYIIFGGEALLLSKLKEWKQWYPHTKLINMYGITETTVHVTFKEITLDDMDTSISNIGKPIPTLKVYVLDSSMNLLPVGVQGELYVSGKGVARGYLNRPDLTRERFIDNPFEPGTMMYRTGDLARWLPNGELEYLGRADQQVKIRGYRIELGEIEVELMKLDGVREAIVLTKQEEEQLPQLIAYIVADRATVDFGSQLSKALPSYMIPAQFIYVPSIPMTINGKVDKQALLEYKPQNGEKTTCSPPQTHMEKRLAELWKSNIGIDTIGMDDRYFDLGGDSIRAIQLLHSMNREFNSNLQLGDLYRYDSIRTISQQIKPFNTHSDDAKQSKIQQLDQLKEQILGGGKR